MAKGTGYKPSGRGGLAPDPLWWMEQIRKGVEWRNKQAHRASWEQWRNWYRGKWSGGTLPVNVYFKMLRTMVPRVYFRNPTVSITPRRGQDGRLDYWLFSQLLERVDNTLFDRMRLKHAMKQAVQDSFMFGTGIIKMGYGGQHLATPDPVDTSEPVQNRKGQRLEYHSNILPETPWVLRVPTGRFIVPQYTLDWPSTRWAAHEERRHIDDVKSDPTLKHVANIEPGVLVQHGEDALNKIADQVSLIEIRDKKTGEVFILCPTNKDKVLAVEDDELQYDARLPYFPIQFNPDDDGFWAVPDAKILEPHQKEVNEIRDVMRRHRKISVLKYIVRQGAVTADSLTKLMSPNEVAAVVQVDKDAQVQLEQALKELQAGDIPQGLIKADQMEQQVIQEVLGLGVNQFGEYAPGSADRSATEAMIVNQAVQIRTDERRDIVADVLVDITEHLNHLILERWEGSHVVDILGPEGEQIWVEFKAEQLKSLEYDVRVDPDSAVPETRQLRRQNASQVYIAAAQDKAFDPMKLRKWWLGEMYGPQLEDLLVNGGKPQQPMVQPGQPGSSPQNPAQAGQVLDMITKKIGQHHLAREMGAKGGGQNKGQG